MTLTRHSHAPTAARGESRVGAAWVDSGLATGLVVVDANRPAINIAAAHGLLKQFGAAH